jgi:hypothetical protein
VAGKIRFNKLYYNLFLFQNQARHVKDQTQKGLIPSQYLEERRKAFVPPENDFSKTSRK